MQISAGAFHHFKIRRCESRRGQTTGAQNVKRRRDFIPDVLYADVWEVKFLSFSHFRMLSQRFRDPDPSDTPPLLTSPIPTVHQHNNRQIYTNWKSEQNRKKTKKNKLWKWLDLGNTNQNEPLTKLILKRIYDLFLYNFTLRRRRWCHSEVASRASVLHLEKRIFNDLSYVRKSWQRQIRM